MSVFLIDGFVPSLITFHFVSFAVDPLIYTVDSLLTTFWELIGASR